MVLLTFIAAHHQAANTLVRQQSFVYRKVGEVGFDRHLLLGIQWLARLDGVQRRRRIAWVVGKWIGRQTRREVVAHGSTLRSRAGIAPAPVRCRPAATPMRDARENRLPAFPSQAGGAPLLTLTAARIVTG
jgi:hypothetical protein